MAFKAVLWIFRALLHISRARQTRRGQSKRPDGQSTKSTSLQGEKDTDRVTSFQQRGFQGWRASLSFPFPSCFFFRRLERIEMSSRLWTTKVRDIDH